MSKKKILFVDSTIRRHDESRTYQLCRVYLDSLAANLSDCEVNTVNLCESVLLPNGRLDVELRDELKKAGNQKHELLDYAREFAAADMIVIGAPYWDLSFPSVLKVYMEKVCVSDITFCYRPDGVKPLCSAEKCVYITTAGGVIGDCDFGMDYIRGLCKQLFGITKTDRISAEMLDIDGVDVEAVMARACEEAKEKAMEAARELQRA